MSIQQIMLGLGVGFPVNSADFDGANDFLTRGADWGGSADSKQGIFSAWLRLDGSDGSLLVILDETLAAMRVERTAGNKLRVTATNTAGVTILDIATSNSYTAGATWLHLLSSWDLATAGARHLYINDTSDLSVTTFTNDTIDYTKGNHSVGATVAGATKFDGCFAEFYFAQGQYLDLSTTSNRRKFNIGGKPVFLGTDGSRPTGTAPTLYLHLSKTDAASAFGTNLGTGGGMTITGSLDLGSTAPS